MQPNKKMTALIIQQYGSNLPTLTQTTIPTPTQTQILVQLQATTINPSDKLFLNGFFGQPPLPRAAGLEGVGRVIQGPNIGKRVCFFNLTGGSWAEYVATDQWFEIDEDVPVSSAASGVVNPLTVLGMVDTFRKGGYHGIVHTAAASALGRMLNKICQSEKIPLLNVVRRQSQADLLKSQGAEHILITQGDWHPQYLQLTQNLKFDLFFDCLSGGQVTEQLLSGLHMPGTHYIYGTMANQKLTIPASSMFFAGLQILPFMMMTWYGSLGEGEKKKIRESYSRYLKGELATKTAREFGFGQLREAVEYGVKYATEGKVLLRPK